MKLLGFAASSVWLAVATASPLLEKRQQFSPFAVSPLQKPMKFKETTGTIRPNSKHVNAIYGPFEIPAAKPGAGPEMGHSHGSASKSSGKSPTDFASLITPENIGSILKGDIQPILKQMPGFSMDPGGTTVLRRIAEGICKDCTVIRGRAGLTNENGDTISIGSGVYLHHIGLLPDKMSMSPTIIEPKCSNVAGGSAAPNAPPRVGRGSFPNMLFVQGVENFTTWYTTRDGQSDSGYYAGDGNWNVIAEVVNYKPEKQNVYITFDYDYVQGRTSKEAYMSYASVTGCLSPTGEGLPVAGFRVKQGKTTITGLPLDITKDGVILNARGHMHDGGSGVKLMINDKVVCDSKAIYGGSESTFKSQDGKQWETISSMTECSEPVRVKKGDKLTIEADFDTELHPARKSGEMEAEEMGIYFLTFMPDEKEKAAAKPS